MMDENRLYQYAYPKLPCSFVGKWHVSADMNEYWLTINKDATFSVEAIKYAPQPLRTGVWSSTSVKEAIQFFDDGFFWPINQYSVEWLTSNHFSLHEDINPTVYYYRHSEPDPACKFQRL